MPTFGRHFAAKPSARSWLLAVVGCISATVVDAGPAPAFAAPATANWVDVSIQGLIATGTTHITVPNDASTSNEMRLFDVRLPHGAVVTGFKAGVGNALQAALTVTADWSSQEVSNNSNLRPDLAVIYATSSARTPFANYTVQLAPGKRGPTTFEITWSAPVPMLDETLHLELPLLTEPAAAVPLHIRSNASALAATVTTTQVGAQSINAAQGDFSLPSATDGNASTDILVKLVVANDKPRIIDHVETVGACTAHSVSAMWPTPNAAAAMANAVTVPRRVMLVIDGSKSMDAIGRAPVLGLVDQVLTQLASIAPTAQVHAVVFERNVSALLPTWSLNNRETQHALLSALRVRVAHNGTDPSTAITFVASELQTALAKDAAPIDIVWISDAAYSDATNLETFAPLLQSARLPANALRFHGIIVNEHQAVTAGASANASGVFELAAATHKLGGSTQQASLGVMSDDRSDGPLATLANNVAIGTIWSDVTFDEKSPVTNLPALKLGQGHAPTLGQYWSCPGAGPHSLRRLAAPRARLDDVTTALTTTQVKSRVAALIGATAEIAELEPDHQSGNNPQLERIQARLQRQIVQADNGNGLVVVDTSTVAGRQRAAALRSGMPFVQLIPELHRGHMQHRTAASPRIRIAQPIVIAPTLVKETLERVFRDQLMPRTRVCYQRALAQSNPAALPQGVAYFDLLMGRGEVIRAEVSGINMPSLNACLLEVGYSLDLPLPVDENGFDELVQARYPVTLQVQKDQATVMPGDADSPDAIDIEAVKPFDPSKPQRPPRTRVQTAKPLDGLPRQTAP